MESITFAPAIWAHAHPYPPESFYPQAPMGDTFRPYQYSHQIRLTNVVINRATKYVDNYDLVEARMTRRARKIGTTSTRIELSSYFTEVRRRYRYTYANGGVKVDVSEIKSGTRILSLHRSLLRTRTFFSTSNHLIPDGVLKSDRRTVDPTTIQATALFNRISRVENNRTQTGNASVHQGQRDASNASNGFTFIGGVGLIPTPLTAAIGAAATVGGIGATAISQLKGPESYILLHDYRKDSPIVAPR